MDPYLRRFVSTLIVHSLHGQFIDPRHIGHTTHLWAAFVQVACKATRLRYLSADFTGLQTVSVSAYTACRSLRVGVSGRYSLIPPIG